MFGFCIVEVFVIFDWCDKLRVKCVGKGGVFLFFVMFGMIVFYLVYNYVLRFGVMFFILVFFFVIVVFLGLLILFINWILVIGWNFG